MSARRLLIAVLLLAALGGLAYWSDKAKKSEEAKSGTASDASKLVKVKDDEIQKIEVVRKDQGSVVIQRNKSNAWEMASPAPLRVDQDAANSLVSAYTGLSQDRVVEEKASDLATYGLASPPVEVRVSTKDSKVQRLLIGDETPTKGSHYAKLENDPKVFTIYSGTKGSLDKSAADLRDKRLLTFDSEKVTRVELTAKGQTVEFGKNSSNEWQIVKPRPLRADNGQVEELVRKLKDAKMDMETSAFATLPRTAIASVTDASGTQQLEVRKNAKESAYYAKSSVVEGTYKVPNDLGEALDKTVNDFRNKKLFDFGFSDPNKVEIRDGAKTYSFQKTGDKWSAGGKQMDSVGVQSLIDKLRDLTSIKFVETGFTTPAIDLTVTSNDGKRVEKVSISKSGNSYFARRENEPAIYELDGKAVEELQRAAADVKEPPPPPKK